jgi:hypothetical protein
MVFDAIKFTLAAGVKMGRATPAQNWARQLASTIASNLLLADPLFRRLRHARLIEGAHKTDRYSIGIIDDSVTRPQKTSNGGRSPG